MFILIDTDLKGLMPAYDYVNELDDKPVLGFNDLDNITDYSANGDFHIVDTYSALSSYIDGPPSRWHQLYLATLGARVFSYDLDKDSPVYAGPPPALDKIRKISVEGKTAEERAGFFAQFGVNYLGRTKISPRNIFVLDNKKGNPLHDPSKDEVLSDLYESLPEDWWGSCGFVSSGNADKLGVFLDSFDGDVIPLAWTTGAFSKLKYLGLDYVTVEVPRKDPKYGTLIRERANRLSYELSQPANPQPLPETGFKYNI